MPALLDALDEGQCGRPVPALRRRHGRAGPREPLNQSAAALSGSFAPTYRFENLEILRSRWRLCRLTDAACPLRVHKVFLQFPNLNLEQNPSLTALAIESEVPQENKLRQHRTIASSAFVGYFSPNALAELCSAAKKWRRTDRSSSTFIPNLRYRYCCMTRR